MTPRNLLACMLQMGSLGESRVLAASEHLAPVIFVVVQDGGLRDPPRSITQMYCHKRADVWTPDT